MRIQNLVHGALMAPKWDEPELAVGSDSKRTARYRRLQSLWRESVIGLPPGQDSKGKSIGSWLPEPSASQWLTPVIAAYVETRVPEALRDGEAIEQKRLRTNLLSSQPLCFNIFGQFAAQPESAARVLSRTLDLQIDSVDEVLVEHAPPTARTRLGDRTAFDAFVRYTHPDGRGFLGVETKYTEPFSAPEYESSAYFKATNDPEGWFSSGSVDIAKATSTNQLWRNCMLAQLTEQTDMPVTGSVVVLSVRDDPHADAAVRGMHSILKEPKRRLLHASLEELTEHALEERTMRAWACMFRSRYLLTV